MFGGQINQAADVMQTLRGQMGDVHGTRPTIESVVYNSVKWAVIICSLLR